MVITVCVCNGIFHSKYINIIFRQPFSVVFPLAHIILGFLFRGLVRNGKCIGETAPDIFFYESVEGDTSHKVSTESEFSPNDLIVKVKSGMNYFIRQYIKLGIFVGGAGLELVDEEKGKEEVSKLNMATKGTCSN